MSESVIISNVVSLKGLSKNSLFYHFAKITLFTWSFNVGNQSLRFNLYYDFVSLKSNIFEPVWSPIKVTPKMGCLCTVCALCVHCMCIVCAINAQKVHSECTMSIFLVRWEHGLTFNWLQRNYGNVQEINLILSGSSRIIRFL